jgi:hypothetical protein
MDRGSKLAVPHRGTENTESEEKKGLGPDGTVADPLSSLLIRLCGLCVSVRNS